MRSTTPCSRRLIDTGERLKTERGLRAVVLSGEGRAFCAGLDMGRFGKMAEARRRRAILACAGHGIANRPQYAVWVWREIPVPVIAAVHGVALRRRLPAHARGRYALCGTADPALDHGDQMGTGAGHGRDPAAAPPGARRYCPRADLYRRVFSPEEALAYGIATRICADPRAVALEPPARSPARARAPSVPRSACSTLRAWSPRKPGWCRRRSSRKR
ncbi:MAG: enoyl-CoA hydratase-related protein [Aliidongia sp.]